MDRSSNKVLDLGDYHNFSLARCLSEKMNSYVIDEGGLRSPLSISLVIPTKFATARADVRRIEKEALKKILSECSELVDVGYLDEILVIDATRKETGKPDFRILQDVVSIAYDELGLFREQVDLLNQYGSQNLKGKRGFIDFFIKVVHQFDDNITRVLAKFGVFGVTGFFGVPFGKGAGLWLSIPITSGDLLCFTDSDVYNFKKEFVSALCHPIVFSWNLKEAALKFVKAYYQRVTKTPDLSSEEYIPGGRICRLFAIPFIQATTTTLNLYMPLSTLKYPLSGEFALSRDAIEQLHFAAKYSVEMDLQFQLLNLVGHAAMAQVDLKTFHHIGQTFLELESMVQQIGTCVLDRIVEKRETPLTAKEKQTILLRYQQNAEQMIDNVTSQLDDYKEVPGKLVYTKKDEQKRVEGLFKILEKTLHTYVRTNLLHLSSWKEIKENTGNYFILREMLRRRSNQSTWSRLKECNLLKESTILE